jgi:hypothetical protein
MKKTLALICTLALLMGVLAPFSAFAAGTFSPGSNTLTQTERDILSTGPLTLDGIDNETISSEVIGVEDEDGAPVPVYGYVGEDANITDPDPDSEDPTKPPVVSPTGINVSVPTKILWAAFASDDGDVTSPTYQIRNNSTAIDLDVSIAAFTPETDANNPANAKIDKDLVLTLNSTDTGELGDTAINIFNKKGSTGSYDAPNPLSHASGTPLEPTSWGFTIGGHYYGDFGGVAQSPTYKLTLGFAIHE